MTTYVEELKIAYSELATAESLASTAASDIKTVNVRIKNVINIMETPVIPPAPPKPKIIIGTNDGSGWGPIPAKQIISAGIKSERLEGTSKFAESKTNEFSNNTVIVGNISNESTLGSVNISSWVSSTLSECHAAQESGAIICEVINEPHLKGGKTISGKWVPGPVEPTVYAKMYSALHKAKVSAGLTIPLGFYTAGDWYNSTTRTWEQDASFKGWDEAAIAAVPSLKEEIDCIVSHPYGKAHTTGSGDTGPGGLEDQLKLLTELGVINANKLYITEYGEITTGTGASELATQASAVEAAYVEFLAMSQTKGIWYYQSHDDSNGKFGLIDNSTRNTRPVFNVVASFAQKFNS